MGVFPHHDALALDWPKFCLLYGLPLEKEGEEGEDRAVRHVTSIAAPPPTIQTGNNRMNGSRECEPTIQKIKKMESAHSLEEASQCIPPLANGTPERWIFSGSGGVGGGW